MMTRWRSMSVDFVHYVCQQSVVLVHVSGFDDRNQKFKEIFPVLRFWSFFDFFLFVF